MRVEPPRQTKDAATQTDVKRRRALPASPGARVVTKVIISRRAATFARTLHGQDGNDSSQSR